MKAHDKNFRDSYYKAIDAVNKAYNAEDYDTYEQLLERYARKFDEPVWKFEDDCTDVRLYGKDVS